MSSSFPQASQGIQAVAEQIQDRVLQLSSERAVLELVKAERVEQQALLDEAEEECGAVRRDYLAAFQTRHGVELELWNLQLKKQDCIDEISSVQQETEELVDDKTTVLAEFQELMDGLVDHELKREIYRHSLQAAMEARANVVEKRNLQLQSLDRAVEKFHADEIAMEEEKKRLVMEIEGQKEAEEEEDENLSKLAQQVKEMIEKRANLRRSLRDHKAELEEANENYLKWEKECVEMSNESL